MFNTLQIGRGLAALAVVLYHATIDSAYFYGTAFNNFWAFGHIGVDFFFVLSGFIISYAHQNDSLSDTSKYIRKRIVRVYPPFIIISLSLFLLYLTFPLISASDRSISLVSSIFLIPSESGSPALSVSWTLMHEMLFYLVFITSLYSRFLFKLLSFIWVVLILFNSHMPHDNFYVSFLLNPHNLQFLLGCLAFYSYKKIYRFRQILLFFGGGMLVMFVQNSNMLESSLTIKLYLGFTFSMLIIALLNFEKNKEIPSDNIIYKALLFLGAASYSVYLVHNPLLSVLNRVGAKINSLLEMNTEFLFIIFVIISILAGCIYHIVIELPLTKKLNNFLLGYSK